MALLLCCVQQVPAQARRELQVRQQDSEVCQVGEGVCLRDDVLRGSCQNIRRIGNGDDAPVSIHRGCIPGTDAA